MPLLAISRITIGERIRKHFGDLQKLAESMEALGQLQPIGVTSENDRGEIYLVFGERRLRAARDVLHWEQIEANTVDLDAIILGEFHENELRKDFTTSERVAIGKAIEAYLGNRQGQRTDKELVANLPQVEPGKKTRELAAEKAGFGSATMYRQAKKVVEQAEPEIVQAVDDGALRVSQAAKVIEAPPDVQREVAALAQNGQTKEARETIRQFQEEESPNGMLEDSPNNTAVSPEPFDLEPEPPEDGYEWDNTIDTLEDIMDRFTVVLEGIRERGGIREFFREWPDAHRAQFIDQAERYVGIITEFIQSMKAEVNVINVN